jgi:class 3 adenylate cyclase/DNA-binding CsgD family transcriptional regulator
METMADLGTTTATILFTDVVGSTELRGRLGESAADRVFIEHRRRLGTVIARHGGHIVKYTGDGVMASFAAASTAVHAAAAIQADVAEYGGGIVVRVGVAVGDVTREGDDYFGLPVVAAARLEAAAEGGQILVTESVRLLAGDRAGDRYEALGPMKLKGIAEPVVAYAVDWDRPPAAADGDGRWARLSLPLALAGCARHPFVGRDEDLAVLRGAWDEGRQGPGRIVLIGGEAGAGKTRLASEFAREAHGQGAWVLYGGCDDDLALPYQPWVQAADQLLAAMPKSSLEGTVTAELAPLAQLLTRAEWLAAQPSKATVDPDAARYRTYGAFAALLAEAGRDGPGLVVLDDLHWAGPQTLALLRHLARTGLPTGVLVVGTFRDTGDEVTDSLSSCLADLRRVDGAIRLHLAGLGIDAVERFVAETVGHELDDDLRRIAVELTDRSGGNAFYLSELWRHLSESAGVGRDGGRWVVAPASATIVPDSVRDVVSVRLAGLSPSARRVIDLAALCGQRIDLHALEPAAGLAPDELDAAVAELVAAGLLAGIAGEVLVHRFEHSIVRDTVEAGIAGRRRARLHLELAHAIETVYEADRRPVLADLARHFAAATPVGQRDKAVYYGRRAAAQAMRAAAYDEAVAHLDVVLGLTTRSVERAEVLVEMGTVEMRRASYRASREACLEAYEIATELGAGPVAADAAVGFEMGMHFPGLPGGPAAEMLRRALDMIGDDASAVRARTTATLGRDLVFAGHSVEGLATAESAVALARAVGDPGSLMVALQAVVTSSNDPSRQLSAGIELAELAARLGDPWSASYATANELRACIALGRLADAAEALERHRVTSTAGRFAPFQFIADAYAAVLALANADFSAAEAAAEQAEARATADSAPYDEGVYGLQMYAIRRAEGRLAEVAPVMRALATAADPPSTWRPGLAALYTDLGMLDEARAVFDTLAPEGFAAVPRDAVWPASLTFLAETCIALRDQANASVLYDELIPFRGHNLMAGMTICFGPADRLLGGLAVLLGRAQESEEHFRVALDLAERSASPLWTAEVQYDWAAVLTASEPERARELAEQAIATAQQHGIGRLIGRAVPGAGAGECAPAPSLLPDSLSEREGEVLRLVATGRSNRDIGATLFISENTVANHVRAILRKTGCANRTEASLYAARRGLLDG